MSANVRISHEEWQEAINQGQERIYDDALTVAEWAKRLGMHVRKASAWIRQGLEQGWMERVLIQRERVTGQLARNIGFRLSDPPVTSRRRT